MGRRGVHLSRTSVAFLAALAAWFVVISWGSTMLQRPSVRRWMGGQLATRLGQAIGQRVAIHEVRVGLVPLRIGLIDVEVGPAHGPALTIAVAEVNPSGVRWDEREIVIDSLRLKGVRVDTQLPEMATGDGGRSWLRVRIKQVEVEDVEVAQLALPSGLVVRVQDLDALMTGSRRTPLAAAVVRASKARLEAPGIEPLVGSVQAWGRSVPGAFEVRRLLVDGGGVRVDARGIVGGRTVRAEGTAALDLAWLDRTVHARAELEGDVALRWRAFRDPVGSWTLNAQVTSPGAGAAGFVVAGIEAEVELGPEGIEASLSRGRFAGGSVEGSYRLAQLGGPWAHSVAVRGEALSLAAFVELLGIDSAGLGADFRATAELAWNGTDLGHGRGTAVANLRPRSADVPVGGRVHVALDGDRALGFSTHDLTLAEAPTSWQGTITLGDWVPNWSIQVKKARVETVARLLRGWIGSEVLPERLRGTTALDLRLRGPFTNLTVVGDVAVAPISFGPVAADALSTSLQVRDGTVRFDEGLVFVGSGRVSCVGAMAFGQGGALDFEISGRGVPLERAIGWSGLSVPVAGLLAAEGHLGGTLDEPRLEARVDLAKVLAAGVPFGDGSGQVRLERGVLSVDSLRVGSFSANARLDLGQRLADVDATVAGLGLQEISPPLARLAGGEMDLQLAGSFPFDAPMGRLRVSSTGGGRGFVELGPRGVRVEVARPAVWRLEGELSRDDQGYAGEVGYAVESLRQLARDLAGFDVPVEGSLAGTAGVSLASSQPARIDGTVRELTVVVEGEEAHLERPFQFTVEGSRIELGSTTLVGEHASLTAGGVREADGRLRGRVDGQLPAALLELVWPATRPTGSVIVHTEIGGTDAQPRFAGTAEVKDGSLLVPGLPAPVSHVHGRFGLIPEAVRLDNVEFTLLGGSGQCTGQVALSPNVELDLAMRFNRLRWPLGSGLNPVLAGTARLVGPLSNLSLTGDATLQRTLYTRPLDLQRLIIEGVLAPVRARAVDSAPVAFNLGVEVPGTLELRTDLARLVARGDLRVVGTSAEPGVLGSLEALPGGELEASGIRYELVRGQVSFTDPQAIRPFLDILARTTIQGFEITVGLVGTLDRMTPSFTSNPPLPQWDIISLVSMGKRADEAGSAQAGTVASSFLTDQLTNAVASRARTLLDVDQLRVDPFGATESGDPTARLTVVKQLSRNWSVTVATNLTSNREEVVTSRVRLGPGLLLDAQRQADGSYSLELKWQHRY